MYFLKGTEPRGDEPVFDEIDKILKSLSSFDKQVFKLYMDGLSIGEIAKRYSKSKKTIYNSLSHIKEKIKTYMFMDTKKKGQSLHHLTCE